MKFAGRGRASGLEINCELLSAARGAVKGTSQNFTMPGEGL